jgi:hypothetical protein
LPGGADFHDHGPEQSGTVLTEVGQSTPTTWVVGNYDHPGRTDGHPVA